MDHPLMIFLLLPMLFTLMYQFGLLIVKIAELFDIYVDYKK